MSVITHLLTVKPAWSCYPLFTKTAAPVRCFQFTSFQCFFAVVAVFVLLTDSAAANTVLLRALCFS